MSANQPTTCNEQITSMIGRQFGRWIVVSEAEKSAWGKRQWFCRCECGKEKPVYERYLLKGTSTSCGCFSTELTIKRSTIHGHCPRGKHTTEYNSWSMLRARCYDPKSKDYPNYGGRGIKVCHRWLESFEAFLEDMGLKPSPRHQIDRFPDNNGDYEPDNCRWASPKENASNQRRTVFLEHDGKRMTQSEWSRTTGLASATILERRRAGWSDERVLTTPRQSGRKL